MKHIANALPESLEHMELWVWNCKHVTNQGLDHVMGAMHGCKRLQNVKIYAGKYLHI